MKDLSEYVYKTERAFRKPTVERVDRAMSPDYRLLGEQGEHEDLLPSEIISRLVVGE